MSDSTVSPVKASVSYSRLTEIDWLCKVCFGCYPYNVVFGALTAVPLQSICPQKPATDRLFTTCKVGEIPIRFGKSQLMATSKAGIADEAAGV